MRTLCNITFMSINSLTLNGEEKYNNIDKENINVRLIDVYLLPNSAVF